MAVSIFEKIDKNQFHSIDKKMEEKEILFILNRRCLEWFPGNQPRGMSANFKQILEWKILDGFLFYFGEKLFSIFIDSSS